jgi:hypothetical protein
MPRAIVNFIFYIPGLINTAYKKAQQSVFIDVLVEKVAQVIGYEATLADVAWNVKVLENHSFKFKFKGYNDKLGYFISQLFTIVKDLSTNGLQESESFLVDNAIEKMTKEYRNLNVDINSHTSYNRYLLLLEDQYHGDVMAQTLVEHKEQIKQEIMTTFVRSCLSEIRFTKMVMTGNLNAEEAKEIADGVVQTLQLKPEN